MVKQRVSGGGSSALLEGWVLPSDLLDLKVFVTEASLASGGLQLSDGIKARWGGPKRLISDPPCLLRLWPSPGFTAAGGAKPVADLTLK